MSEEQAVEAPGHAGTSGGEHGARTDPGDTHGHDDHGHGEATLGPVDVAAWGAGILGVAIAVLIALAFVIATGSVA